MTEVLTYEALKAERDALAVENAALNKSLDDVCESYENGQSDLLSEAIDKAINLPSPATDAALAAIKAQGVEKFAAQQEQLAADYRKLSPGCYGETSSAENALMARDFAAKLREGK
ncbi:hypothetical protein ACV1WV_06865 [Serratia marcescens]